MKQKQRTKIRSDITLSKQINKTQYLNKHETHKMANKNRTDRNSNEFKRDENGSTLLRICVKSD